MRAVGLDDQCINSGGQWCTAAAMWETSLGKFLLIGMAFCIVALVWSLVSRARRSVRSFIESKKGDL